FRAVMLADDHTQGIDSGLQLDGIRGFSRDGKRIFLDLREKEGPKAGPDVAKVDIWSYKDARLQSQQLQELEPERYLAVLPTDGGRVLRLEQANERADYLGGMTNEFILVEPRAGGGPLGEANWNPASRAAVYLESLRDGQRRLIRKYIFGGNFLSPAE